MKVAPDKKRCAFFLKQGTCCHPENPDRASVAADDKPGTCPQCDGDGVEYEHVHGKTCSWCQGTGRWFGEGAP